MATARERLAQLAGYAMLLEEQEALPAGSVGTGLVYVLPADDVVSVQLDDRPRGEFVRALQEMRAMLATETFPPATRHRGFCPECEFVNFCGDAL